MREALKYLQAGAIVPVDMETTILLVNALKEALAQPAQEPWPEEPFGHMAGGVQPAQEPTLQEQLTEEQIWKCNRVLNENGEIVGVHICLDHQNVVDFARSIEREIGFSKAKPKAKPKPKKQASTNGLHTCPYAEEIHGDYEKLCDCDEESTRQCAWDI